MGQVFRLSAIVCERNYGLIASVTVIGGLVLLSFQIRTTVGIAFQMHVVVGTSNSVPIRPRLPMLFMWRRHTLKRNPFSILSTTETFVSLLRRPPMSTARQEDVSPGPGELFLILLSGSPVP